MEQSGLQIMDPVTRAQVERAAEALQREFAGIFSRETIARYIAESSDLLGDSKLSIFVPVLAHRFARERLKALAQVEGLIAKEQPEVLFVCVHNSGRSQMAAGLVKLRSHGRIHVRSAGSDPGEQINPAVIDAMAELGVDMSQEFPKPLTDEVVAPPTRSSPWGAATPARSTPASATRTGNSKTPPAKTSRPCVGSATTSTCACRS